MRSDASPRAEIATAGVNASGGPSAGDAILIRGARVHNLKSIDCEIPHNRLTVITGVSGSGKSSLAFDTLYAEGQRRYVESLSAYARQFLERMEKPDADEIANIAPAVAIRQKNATRNPRSTVGTATEIYDYLRLLYSRIGVTTCPGCGQVVKKDTVEEVADAVLSRPAGQRFYVLFPLLLIRTADDAGAGEAEDGKARRSRARRGKKDAGETKPGSATGPRSAADDVMKVRLQSLRKSGFIRLYQSGRTIDLSEPESILDLDFSRPIEVLVDRLSVSPEGRSRLIDSIEICYREAGETALEFLLGESGGVAERLTFNERFECKQCKKTLPAPEPRLFSFNNPYGACPRCQGFGNTVDFSLDRVVPDPAKTLVEGAVEPWTKPRYRVFQNEMKRAARERGVPLDTPFHKLTAADREWLIEGGEHFGGVRGFFRYLDRKKYKLHVRVFISRYRSYTTCPECHGGRLRAEALNVRVNGRNIVEVSALPVHKVREFFAGFHPSRSEETVAGRIFEEIRSRLDYLDKVGLEYLTLDRLTATLSGGEAQRIQLATALGSNLVGALYILDEPSIGLHPRDTNRLIEILKNLRDLGNTMVVVEHDPEMIRQADKILDLGPGAGEQGGRVVYSGDLEGLVRDPHSLTGRYIAGELTVAAPAERLRRRKARLKILGARCHNLKAIDLEIPLGLLVCVSGVSGSGKSTLVYDVLYNALMAKRGASLSAPPELNRLEGDEGIDRVILVDQSPLGRTPRSNPVTYIGAFDAIRACFASTPAARSHGYGPGRFSFNVPGGRCEVCRGEGTVTVEMQFLADVELLCDECRGKRFKPSTLKVTYKGKNIADVLEMTVKEALAFFADVPAVISKLRVLNEIGLGYLRLGQSATTLSGGEAQRVRLAANLAQSDLSNSLFIFDEPTTGLHFDDISKLLGAFRRLIQAGATVLVIEHNLDVLKSADWIIDLGPEGGEAGGTVIGAGRPEDLAQNPRSYTGKFLAPALAASSRAGDVRAGGV